MKTKMFELPLFPLNTVLFPGMPLALHIFEERYKLMINQCIEAEQPFGVVLIQRGREALGPAADPHPIGCTAVITQVQRLQEGRLNIGAVGHERFRIISLEKNRPYLVGQVEHYPLTNVGAPNVVQAGHRLRPWVSRYMEVLSTIEDVELDPTQLPEEPIALGYLAATLLQMPSEQKQSLLNTSDAGDLLDEMRAVYRREVAVARLIVNQDDMPTMGPFSLN